MFVWKANPENASAAIDASNIITVRTMVGKCIFHKKIKLKKKISTTVKYMTVYKKAVERFMLRYILILKKIHGPEPNFNKNAPNSTDRGALSADSSDNK